MKLTSILTILVVILQTCRAQSGPRIKGGYPCSTRDHPYMVQISSDMENTTCTGTLIESTLVVTAAHCIWHQYRTKLIFNRDSYWTDLTDPENNREKLVSPKRCYVHDKFDTEKQGSLYDIALCVLYAKIPYTYPKPIYHDPNYQGDFSDKCSNYQILGWGEMEPGVLAGRLMCANGVQPFNDTCRNTHQLLCTNPENAGPISAAGDSGGPIICDGMMVIGVCKGRRKYKDTRIGLWTKPHVFRDFINQVRGRKQHKKLGRNSIYSNSMKLFSKILSFIIIIVLFV